MNSPTDLAACLVIQRIFDEKWDISIVQLRGWGSLGSGRGLSSLCALRMAFGPLAEGHPASRPPCSEIRAYLTWVPQKSDNLCVLNGAPHLPSELPESPIPATASLQLGHQPPTPSCSREAPGSVLLPSFWSSGCRSCHALTSSVQATSILHLDYRSFLLTSLSASGFAPPPSRHCNRRGSFTTGHSSHPSPSSSLPELLSVLQGESPLASATLPGLLLSEEVASFPSLTSYPQSEGPVASLCPRCTHRPTLRSPVVPPECYIPQQLFRTGAASCSPLFPVPRMVFGNTGRSPITL
uniref:uncharacterized protein LOC118540333 isoform X2 n=1 Tax=Halichoerus grypus TaxID=9711 RepID=UPI001658EDA7|nr:uncharacterized protein LOC118540333 isoform X2 [Halichoerus grypus]